jgi:hypothetical protein
VQRFRWAALVAVAAAAVSAGTASAKLTPVEQKWVTPLIQVWNAQNAGLQLVIKTASAKNALVLGEKPENERLAVVIGTLLSCKKPKDQIKLAGNPPSARLKRFVTALNQACVHDQAGAADFTKAILAYSDKKSKAATRTAATNAWLAKGIAEFKKGTAQLKIAYTTITKLGGGKLFTA